jgi:hypothetical protein
MSQKMELFKKYFGGGYGACIGQSTLLIFVNTVGVRFPERVANVSLLHSVETGSGATQPLIQLLPGALSPGVKRPGRETDDSPPSNAELKMIEL